ncbi:glycosyltransferase family 1 protein [Bacillus sp. AFS037270]|uniref:glycosyltransferase family 4 protein n=1 Tax=Bacillus sp. AFS037270 TaxID=2033499 RepID=UPI0020D27A79|nr:glycosyltransferase family 1 protein [Bacillus sp. AFS037270]
MEIFINGRFLTQKITGVQRFALEIIKRINQYTECKVIVLVPKNYNYIHAIRDVEVRKIGVNSGHLWEQIDLYKYVKSKPLINLCNTAPIIKRNQIVVIHDTAVYSAPNGFSKLFKIWYKVLFFFISKLSKKILTISNFSSKEILKYLNISKTKLAQISEGTEHIKEVKENKDVLGKYGLEKGKYVFAVSSLNPNKNFEALIKATQFFQEKSFNIVIAGGTDPKVFGISNFEGNNIKYLGYITDEDLKGLYMNAGCFVFPSIYEGFGLPPLEAMSVGCPVVVSRIGPIPEVCEDAAIYFDPYDERDLANKILMVMNDELLKKELQSKGYQQAQKFSWQNASRQLANHTSCLNFE